MDYDFNLVLNSRWTNNISPWIKLSQTKTWPLNMGSDLKSI